MTDQPKETKRKPRGIVERFLADQSIAAIADGEERGAYITSGHRVEDSIRRALKKARKENERLRWEVIEIGGEDRKRRNAE